MGDYSYLLAGKPIEAPNPMALAGQAMTLGNLGTSMQMNQMNLAAAQQAAAATPEFARGLQSGADPNQILAAIAEKYPYAYPKLLADFKASQLTQAQIEAQQGVGAKDRAAAFKDAAGNLANMATGLLNSGQPLTSFQKQMLSAQAIHAGQVGGYKPSELSVPSVMSSDDQWGQFLQASAAAGTSPKDAFDVMAGKAKLPGELALNQANVGKTTIEAQLAPFIAQSGRTSANAAAQNASTEAGKFAYGTTNINPLSGQGNQVQPHFNPATKTWDAVAAPVAGANGAAPPQLGMGAVQKEAVTATGDRLKKAQEDIATYNKVQQALPLLEATLRQGYNGPIMGSDTGKAALAILSQIPGINSMVDMNKLANSKAADAIQGELIGSLIKEISTRGSNMATKVVLARKPGTENPLEASLSMINALKTDSQNGINSATTLLDYANHNPTDISLTGYKAPIPKLPSGSGQSYAVTAPNGKVYTFPNESSAMEFKAKAGIL